MGSYASLREIRRAILCWRVVRFVRAGRAYVAEPHLLGHARRTGALVLMAWIREPVQEWRIFRYSELRELEAHAGRFDGPRPDYAINYQLIHSLDTAIQRFPH